MPIPQPTNNESEKEFIQRCMADSKMTEEYEIEQRYAVCQDAFKTKLAGEKISFDFDGTLAKDHSANAPEINKNVKKLHKKEKKRDIIVLTARSEKDRGEVEGWLNKHDIHPDELVMRPKGDKEDDSKVKKHLLKDKVSRQFNVKEAYDDAKQIGRAHV